MCGKSLRSGVLVLALATAAAVATAAAAAESSSAPARKSHLHRRNGRRPPRGRQALRKSRRRSQTGRACRRQGPVSARTLPVEAGKEGTRNRCTRGGRAAIPRPKGTRRGRKKTHAHATGDQAPTARLERRRIAPISRQIRRRTGTRHIRLFRRAGHSPRQKDLAIPVVGMRPGELDCQPRRCGLRFVDAN